MTKGRLRVGIVVMLAASGTWLASTRGAFVHLQGD